MEEDKILAEIECDSTAIIQPPADWNEILMTIPHHGLSPLLEKAKDSRRWEDLIAYLDQLEHTFAKMLSN